MKKICIVIPDGTGIRNYLYSDLISELHHKKSEVILVHSLSKEAIEEINRVHKCSFKTYELPVYKETLFQKFLRESVCYARLLHNSRLVNNSTILNTWKPNTKNFKNKLFYQFVKYIAGFASFNYNRILKLEKKYTKLMSGSCKKQKQLLKEIKPDVIFSTHQRAMNAVPLVNAAKQLNIKTIGAIFSWDNVPKARLTVRTDEYVVWSSYMKQEMNMFYPEIKNENIEITGTPQFEFHYNFKFVIDRESFFKQYKLDSSKRIICFSGDDLRTSPFDANYLKDIVEVIQKEKLNIQILLRRAPVDTSGRFDKVVGKYPNIIKEAAPLWNFDKDDVLNWQVIYPKYEDVDLLISTAKYCDAVINVGSTMAHDFSLMNKPAIYINYNSVKSNHWNIDTIYKFQHFKSMGDLNPVFWLNSKKDIKEVLFKVENNIELDNLKWVNIIAEHRETASLNIAKKIIECI